MRRKNPTVKWAKTTRSYMNEDGCRGTQSVFSARVGSFSVVLRSPTDLSPPGVWNLGYHTEPPKGPNEAQLSGDVYFKCPPGADARAQALALSTLRKVWSSHVTALQGALSSLPAEV